ncbi:MAG TPA: helix-turn-helix transcriptional regulator [Pyrinomonadaceae bacterium]|nr:helix-turn-helix transcriptional regulator [Pyrinomonadaceae bacterium]
MGHARPRPKHLAAKLLQIRKALGLSQNELAERLNARQPHEFRIPYNNICKYEKDKNEPPLTVLLAYSRVSGIRVERIIDDALTIDLSAIADIQW